jgi:hypothetical protein
VPSLSVETLSTLAIVVLGVSLACLVWVAVLAWNLAQVRRRYRRLLAGTSESEDILAAVDRHLAAVERLHDKTDLMGREIASIRQRISMLVSTVGFTRYDAFDDVGGRLSYSAAFLNEAGDGVVLSGINSRSETRSYAKRVEGGRSSTNMSDEERTAIALALGLDAAATSGSAGAHLPARSGA